MKAKAGFLMLLIGMMCFTGFGKTTTDLTDNSTDLTIVDCHDVELNVVAVTFQVSKNQTAFSEAGFEVVYSNASGRNELAESFITTTLSDQNLMRHEHSGDVGWQYNFKNYSNSILYSTHPRNPRDGLQITFPFSYS